MIRFGKARWNGKLYAQDRRAAGYTLAELSDITGISSDTIKKYETISEPGVEAACQMADALGYEVTRYITWEAFG